MTPVMTIVLEPDRAFTDEVEGKDLIHLGADAPPIKVALVEGGMQSGKASIAIGLDLGTVGGSPRYVIAEPSLDLFLAAARAFAARTGTDLGAGP
jgi:hypothetical protein